MKSKYNQTVDLLISHNQIQIRSRPFNETLSQWGKKNIDQGAVIYDDYVIFDPLPEDTFGANIHLTLTNDFKIDKDTQRCIVAPFYIRNNENVEIASAAEKFKIDLDFENNLYSLYYEICEGDEIFYKLTFVPSETPITPMYLMDDPWGGKKNKPLEIGLV
ncbi:competence protein ComJ [Gibbsiella greigii]